MNDCIFCKLKDDAAFEGRVALPPHIINYNSEAYLIRDRNPMAPHHILSIARQHFVDVSDLGTSRFLLGKITGHMLALLNEYALSNHLNESGYRILINTGKDAGQTVKHLHMHLLGGATLKNDFGV
jgi:histidine triad (HIT) family protein